MNLAGARPLWNGRALTLIGIVLAAGSLRTAVAALSPIFAEIDGDIGVGSLGLGLLGMLPPLCFAAFGVLTPRLVRPLGLERVLVIGLVTLVIGHFVRAAAPSFAVLALGSAFCFAGIGIGNVVLPPLVKKYFPDRIGLLTSLYATVMAFSTLVPPLVAVPVADAADWHASLGLWGVLGVFALVPWLVLAVRERRTSQAADPELEVAPRADRVLVHRSKIAWAVAIVFGTSALHAYTMFAWLPRILGDVALTTPSASGALLSLYATMGVPASLIVPALVTRMRNVGLVIYFAVGCFVVGYLGLLLWPAQLTWLWVVLIGIGPLLFPMALVLINLRSATHDGAVALSGFVQSIGYTLGALGPILVGMLHTVTGGWTAPILLLLGTALAVAGTGALVSKRTSIEADLAARAKRIGLRD